MSSNLVAVSNISARQLVGTAIASSETTYYTCPAATTAKIGCVTICNTYSSTVYVTLSTVKNGNSPGAGNRQIVSYPLGSNDTLFIDYLKGWFMGPGDFISASASVASVVSLNISGIELS